MSGNEMVSIISVVIAICSLIASVFSAHASKKSADFAEQQTDAYRRKKIDETNYDLVLIVAPEFENMSSTQFLKSISEDDVVNPYIGKFATCDICGTIYYVMNLKKPEGYIESLENGANWILASKWFKHGYVTKVGRKHIVEG